MARIFTRLTSIDLRTLALFRICLALAILLDLASRARNLAAHYTDAGVLPREVLAAGLRRSLGGLIATLWPGTVAAEAVFFVLYALAAVALLVGFRTRAATVVAWLCALGLLARNPLVLHRADTLIKMLLLWGAFLPLGARWSLDALLSRSDDEGPRSVSSPASAGLLLQPCMMFWFAVLSRSPTEWWQEGSALYYASHCDVIVRPLGAALRNVPAGALAWLTRLVVTFEAGLPLLLWSPWATSRVRLVALGFLIAMPTAFGAAFHIGFFPLMCIIAVLPFVPGDVWDSLGALWRRMRARRSPAPGPVSTVEVSWRWSLAAIVLPYSLLLNLDAHVERFALPSIVKGTGEFLGLDQRWDIFAPTPPKQDEWFVVTGRLHDGSIVDVMHEGMEPSLEKPADFGDYFTDYRWRRYWYNLGRYPRLYDYYVAYAARDWDGRHPATRQLDDVRIDLLREKTPPFGSASPAPEIERETVWPLRPPGSSKSGNVSTSARTSLR